MRGKALLSTALAAAICLCAAPGASADPLSGTSGFYVNPGSAPAAWVAAHPSDPRAAGIQSAIASRPIARWFGDDGGDIGSEVSSYVGAANSHGKVPVLVAYDIPDRDVCGGYSGGGASSVGAYESWISGFAAGIGSRPAVVVIEPDALSDYSCLTAAQQSSRTAMLLFATQMFQKKASDTWAYLDAGHTNWVAPATMASELKAAGVANVRGFAVNVSNFYTTGSSETYAGSVNASLGGSSHFVVDTSRNGNGSDGEWCNPSGAKLGTAPQAGGGADLLLWVKTPGVSDGQCGTAPGTPAGTFDPALAVALINGS
ncbi:glycoside hydrolase family 6 protein [Streptacidiphilus sp. N1-12]|uniref:Glycoside hydrolase family 6 protein n=2 Tax=Streptacidiphilus alkalitolerans TaxID=3342712 RepID=A0ABV6VE51_9ACTN